MIIKNYQIFKESNDSGIAIGTNTNKGKVLWMDNPYKSKDDADADISVKTDMPQKGNAFSWHRLSELEVVEEPKKEEVVKVESEVKVDIKPEIQFDDLMKVDIRVCKVLSAEKVKGRDRLLILNVDTGSGEKVAVTNLGSVYKPEDLLNKSFGFVVNLKPSRIAGIESFAMIIAASDSENKPYLIEVKAPVGSKLL